MPDVQRQVVFTGAPGRRQTILVLHKQQPPLSPFLNQTKLSCFRTQHQVEEGGGVQNMNLILHIYFVWQEHIRLSLCLDVIINLNTVGCVPVASESPTSLQYIKGVGMWHLSFTLQHVDSIYELMIQHRGVLIVCVDIFNRVWPTS